MNKIFLMITVLIFSLFVVGCTEDLDSIPDLDEDTALAGQAIAPTGGTQIVALVRADSVSASFRTKSSAGDHSYLLPNRNTQSMTQSIPGAETITLLGTRSGAGFNRGPIFKLADACPSDYNIEIETLGISSAKMKVDNDEKVLTSSASRFTEFNNGVKIKLRRIFYRNQGWNGVIMDFECGDATGGVVQSICGDGIQNVGESCDDGNVVSGDGCSASCGTESGYFCRGTPSTCQLGTCTDNYVGMQLVYNNGNIYYNSGDCVATMIMQPNCDGTSTFVTDCQDIQLECVGTDYSYANTQVYNATCDSP